MFSRYFQSELTYLRELGKEFSAANPSLAGLFAETGGDPDVQRLLEGFAFLAARIRERVDDAVPEVIDALAQMVIPQMARQLPACSIVEFTPNYSALRGIHVVNRNTELGAKPVDKTQCLFSTCAPVELVPLVLKQTSLDQSVERSPRVVLRFERRGGTIPFPEHGRLRFFLDGPFGLTSTVFLWLNQHLQSVTFKNDSIEHSLPKEEVKPVGLSEEMELLSWPEFAPDGLRLAQELFTLPQKLLFIEIGGLDRVPRAKVGNKFELVLQFDRPPTLPERIDDDLFRLHCTPVINLFPLSADPITRDFRVHEHLLRASNINPRHMEVYSVDSVIGLSSQRKNRREYSPFHDFAHLERTIEDRAFYATRRTSSPIDGAIDTYISLMTPSDVEPEFADEVLSIELSCTNRTVPKELRVGDIDSPTPRSPTLAKFTNITEVTRPARPPIGAEMHWKLVSHLALNVQTVTNATALRALLLLYNSHGDSDHQRSRANELRISAIRKVTSKAERRIIDRAAVRGFHTHLEVEERGYASLGDAYLFGCAINWLFVTEVPINSYHRLTMSVHPLGVEFTWPPSMGTQPVF